MRLKHTTPIPNEFFDSWMVEFPAVCLRVFLKIARNTLGWRDSHGSFKQRDWISHSQFGDIGVSSRSVTTATQELLDNDLIVVTDEQGNSLHDPKQRKKARKIYYQIHPRIIEKFALDNSKSPRTTAENATYKAKSLQRPPQFLPSTKETLQNSSEQKITLERLSDRERLNEILDKEQEKQDQRDNWL